jgi:hypothetical protein
MTVCSPKEDVANCASADDKSVSANIMYCVCIILTVSGCAPAKRIHVCDQTDRKPQYVKPPALPEDHICGRSDFLVSKSKFQSSLIYAIYIALRSW